MYTGPKLVDPDSISNTTQLPSFPRSDAFRRVSTRFEVIGIRLRGITRVFHRLFLLETARQERTREFTTLSTLTLRANVTVTVIARIRGDARRRDAG